MGGDAPVRASALRRDLPSDGQRRLARGAGRRRLAADSLPAVGEGARRGG